LFLVSNIRRGSNQPSLDAAALLQEALAQYIQLQLVLLAVLHEKYWLAILAQKRIGNH
jgi:hypothetical protein